MQNNNAYQEIPLSNLRHKGVEYPRERPSGAAISRYVDALKAGETFAPITVYQDEDGTFPVLDGYHRWQAYQDCGLETIQAVVISLNGDHPLLVAARLNARHGVAMGNEEKKEVARTVIIDKLKAKEDITNKELALQLGVREQTIGEWVKDLRAAQTHERDATILRLDLLGWTQEEIGDVVGLDRSRITQIMLENGDSLLSNISDLATAGHALDTIAMRTGLDELLCLALLLKDKDDRARLSYLKIGLQPYDVWNFNGCDDRFGADYSGRIPGQLVAHVLYFFTKAGDWVIDPMAGSGTTNDVCLAMGRRYRGYYVIQYTDEDWELASFRINGQSVSRDDFHRFLLFENIGIASLFD